MRWYRLSYGNANKWSDPFNYHYKVKCRFLCFQDWVRLPRPDLRFRPERSWKSAAASNVVDAFADHLQPRRGRPHDSDSAAARHGKQDPSLGILHSKVPDPCVHPVTSNWVRS